MARSVQKRQHELSIIRDTVESVWVAIILAFVLRAFMLEAFVIPTGSMAPRLMGEHYDLVCQACGYEYSYGWQPAKSNVRVPRREKVSPKGASCPSCTYRFHTTKAYINGGDRVLVMKYLYRFIEPRPFDVVVFRNPQSNANNYIKRLIGLPGETIEIVHGDVYVIPAQDDETKPKPEPGIRRKPDRAQAVMWQIVCDNDYRPDMNKLKEDGMGLDKPRRWEPTGPNGTAQNNSWEETNDGRAFTFKGSDEYNYLTFKGVRAIGASKSSMREAFIPRYGYNSEHRRTHIDSTIDLCGDLKLSFVIKPGPDKAAAECMLKGMWFSFRAVFDTDGGVTVFRKPREQTDNAGTTLPDTDADGWEVWARAKTQQMASGVGRSVELAHVDHSVKIWVDGGKVIDKNYTVALKDLKERLSRAINTPRKAPLPVPAARIGASGGRLDIAHLKLMRDVYYTNFELGRSDHESQKFLTDYADDLPIDRRRAWGVKDNPITLKKNKKSKGEDPDLDEFFVLGDNSPQSLDSRGWIEAAPSLRLYDSNNKPQYKLGTVPRYNMIGKAMFVYWPSGYRLPMLPGLPIIPDVGRMRLIR
ncbi:MAG: signal peptidase I [Phycisphaerae bacterium]|jgi:signal peptidase I|nr:signal peptidase I [Phycisphaerae bacterium]